VSEPGTRSGRWIGDHQPPLGLSDDDDPTDYLPHCLACSNHDGTPASRERDALEDLEKQNPGKVGFTGVDDAPEEANETWGDDK